MRSAYSTQEAKVALFHSLFRGREDVYARRFESLKTGKKGYQPVCRNEWVSGICEKPRTRCDDCRFREYLPVTDNVVRNQLLGLDPQDRPGRDFTRGAYAMLPDETCCFLAADACTVVSVTRLLSFDPGTTEHGDLGLDGCIREQIHLIPNTPR